MPPRPEKPEYAEYWTALNRRRIRTARERLFYEYLNNVLRAIAYLAIGFAVIYGFWTATDLSINPVEVLE